MEIGDTAVQMRLALDLAVAESRGRVPAHVFLNSGQLSPLVPSSVGAAPIARAPRWTSVLENPRMLSRLEMSSGPPPGDERQPVRPKRE